MDKTVKAVLLLMMGGAGTRYGSERPKQFDEIDGLPIFCYILQKYCLFNLLDKVIIVCHPSWIDYSKNWIEKININVDFELVGGGSSRSLSVKNGLQEVSKFASPEDVILIHDVTHPYVDEQTLQQIIKLAQEAGGATLVEPQHDTVYRIDPHTRKVVEAVPRETIVAGASPEAFTFSRIWQAFCSHTDEELEQFRSVGALAQAHGISLETVPTDLINLKITHSYDMESLRLLLPKYFPEGSHASRCPQ